MIDGATALEMTHLGSLYHDDVMDAADKRRGVPSAHAVWGNSVAILTGDLLFSRASQIMARQRRPGDPPAGRHVRAPRARADARDRRARRRATTASRSTSRCSPTRPARSSPPPRRRASSSPTAPQSSSSRIVAFGEKAGVAFQLLDDVIDLSADPDETGKVPGTDLRAGVPTMPYLVLGQRTDAASVALRARIDEGVERIADGADPAILDDALAELREHEATQATLDLAHAWSREAVDALAPAARRRRPRGAHALRPGRRRPFQLTHLADLSKRRASTYRPERTLMTKLRLAIVGAGPAGIYAADILLKAERKFDVSIDLFEQLPAPYGLVRYGVAPDHPRIKGIVTALREVLDRGDIRLFGNVRFGEDITLDDLKHHYNAVIFATGAIRDADLDIPGIDADRLLRRRRLRELVRRPPRRAARVAAGCGIRRRHRQRQRRARRRAHARQARRRPAAHRDPRQRARGPRRRAPSPTCTSSAAAARRR